MARLLVSANFVWDEYPGLRAGHEFAESVRLSDSKLCADCGLVSS